MESLRKQLLRTGKLKRTKTGLLFLSLFGKSSEYYGESYIDSYLKQVDGHYLLVNTFNNVDSEDLRENIYFLQNHWTYFSEDFDDNDKEVVIFNEIPMEFTKDINLFLEGKYTKMSNRLKELIIKIYAKETYTGDLLENGLPGVTIYDVLHPSDVKRKEFADALKVDAGDIIEVMDPPNKELEFYKTTQELKSIYDIK